MAQKRKPTRASYIKAALYTVLYLLFLYWVGSWWGLLVVPFILDAYTTRYINWGWWKGLKNRAARSAMAWVDAIVFALVAVYFLNQFFFQNFVIPSSSLEKTLLTGDYLLVSKLSYGPRIPQTPLSMPLVQHTLPLLECKSYLEKPHWDYRRVKGFGDGPELMDIVVFNYPSGDTVCVNVQDQDFYGLTYQVGQQILAAAGDTALQALTPETPYAEQQAVYTRVRLAGLDYIRKNPEQFGNIVSRPTDRRENYVKRCVGLPGQTLQIRHNIIYIDGKAIPQPEQAQQCYQVRWKNMPTEDLIKELGISQEDLQATDYQGHVSLRIPLTEAAKKRLQAEGCIAEIAPYPSTSEWLYPLNKAKTWTCADYGPIWIPKRGATRRLTLDELPVYERCIRVYEGNTLDVKNGKIYINGKQTDSYTFKLNYYWMQGDNRDGSADSRFWGFVPEDHVVGKPLFVWLSLDKDYGLFSGKIRWNRLFKNVSKIK